MNIELIRQEESKATEIFTWIDKIILPYYADVSNNTWEYETYLNEMNRKKLLDSYRRKSEILLEIYENISNPKVIDWRLIKNDYIHRQYIELKKEIASIHPDPVKWQEIEYIRGNFVQHYSNTKFYVKLEELKGKDTFTKSNGSNDTKRISKYRLVNQNGTDTMQLDYQKLNQIFRKTTDYELLKVMWEGWHNAIGGNQTIIHSFQKMINLSNEAARLHGYAKIVHNQIHLV